MSEHDETRARIERSSSFSLSLLTAEEKWSDERKSHRVHDTVLRPLLRVADACWAYGVAPGSEAWDAASDILTPEKGKHRVEISGDPITGREYFWNAHGGKCGTIVVTVPLANFAAEDVFKECRGAWVFDNYRAGHNLAAIRFAQSRLETQSHVVFCLPRNNGIEWIDLFAPKPLVFALHAKSLALARE